MNWSSFRDYLLNQFSQALTWRGLVLLAVIGGGHAITDAQLDSLVTIAVLLSGAVGALLPDKMGRK